jgi:molybdopterin synthase catalytic subunit/molybdopterin converting factor small subunit
MQVTIRTFAILRELSADRVRMELADGGSIDDAWAAMAARFPDLRPHRPFVRAAHNGAYADWSRSLANDDEVAFLPPVSGGATTGLSSGPIDVAGLEASLADRGHGALVTFIGRARSTSDDGRQVLELDYEVYPELAASVLEQIAGEAEARWPVTIAMVHRIGTVPIGEAAVAIVTGSAHRAEAYEANRFAIEAIKQRLPIWKRERFADGTEWKRPGA